MSTKIRKHFRCTEETNEKIKLSASRAKVSESSIVNQALEYFFKHQGRDFPELAKLFDSVMRGNLSPLLEENKRIRIALNQVSIESQMNMEFWNDNLNEKGEGSLVTTDVKKANQFIQGEANIKNKVLHMQQNKHS